MSKRTVVSLKLKNLWQAVRKVVYARAAIVSVVRLIVLCADLVLASPASTGQEHYDLGGPCKDQPSWPGKETEDAERAREWDRAVLLAKETVRGGCNVPYRWDRLVNALLSAHRFAEASSVLQEMDARGFDLNLAVLGEYFPEIVNFMESNEFGASPLGLKFKSLENISDERRIKFQEALSRMPASEKPPDNYVAKGACPFECCRYGNWTVLEDTDLVSSPGSSRVVGAATKGSRVAGLTGEVHLKPEPVVVVAVAGVPMGSKDVQGDLPKNSIAFILDYTGEGYSHVYTRGKVVEVQTYLSYAKYCFRPSESCWGETLWPSKERREQIWWVKVRLPNGIVGWTDKTNNFGDKDACG
jgi:pentatricopeptide repeat protein